MLVLRRWGEEGIPLEDGFDFDGFAPCWRFGADCVALHFGALCLGMQEVRGHGSSACGDRGRAIGDRDGRGRGLGHRGKASLRHSNELAPARLERPIHEPIAPIHNERRHLVDVVLPLESPVLRHVDPEEDDVLVLRCELDEGGAEGLK